MTKTSGGNKGCTVQQPLKTRNIL